MDQNTRAVERQVPDNREFLTFVLGEEEYGIDILRVQEIRGYDAVTKIANAPAFIKGVINLRGAIVPIIDLRMRFNLDRVEYNEFTVVIILNVLNRTLGIVVDGVSDVAALSLDEIKPPPEFSSTFDTQYLMGLGTVDERMLIIVDIEKLLGSRTMQLLDDSVEQTADVA